MGISLKSNLTKAVSFSHNYLYRSNTIKYLQQLLPCKVRLKKDKQSDMSMATYKGKGLVSTRLKGGKGMNILEEIQDIFRDVFDDEELVISEETSAADIDDWDSLVNIQLMVAIGKHFDVRMTTQEITGFENVGDIVRCIKEKIG